MCEIEADQKIDSKVDQRKKKDRRIIMFKVCGVFKETLVKCKETLLDTGKLKDIDDGLKDIETFAILNPDINCRSMIMYSPLPIVVNDIEVLSVQCVTDSSTDSSTNSTEREVCIYGCSDALPEALRKEFLDKQDTKVPANNSGSDNSNNKPSKRKLHNLHDCLSCLTLKQRQGQEQLTYYTHFSVLQMPKKLDKWMTAKQVAKKGREKLLKAMTYFDKMKTVQG